MTTFSGRRTAIRRKAVRLSTARIVPAADVSATHQFGEHPLGQHRMCEIETREFVLPRSRRNREMFEKPVVQGPVVLEFEGAEGMADVLDGIGLTMGKVVARIDTPGRAGARMARVQNAIEHGVT